MRNEKLSSSKIKSKFSSYFSIFPSQLSISSGFTIIELLVVFTIIVVLSSIGIVSFVTYGNRQLVTQSAANLKQNIDLARFNAISSVKPETCASDDLTSYKVNFCHNVSCFSGLVDYEMTATCAVEMVIQEGNLPQSIVLENIEGETDCATISFDILSGNVTGVPCEINITGNGEEITLSVDANGHTSY